MKKTNVLQGIAAAPGIRIAKAYLYSKEIEDVEDGEITSFEEAISALDEALAKSKKELKKIFDLALVDGFNGIRK